MLRTIAAGLIVTALIASAAVAQSCATSSTPTTMTKHPGIQSNTKSTSRLKQTYTTKTKQIVKHAGKPIVHYRPRYQVVHHHGSGHRHLVGRYHTLSSHLPAASTSQHTQSNGSHKPSKTERNTNTHLRANGGVSG